MLCRCASPARFFILGRGKILSKEESTQVDPTLTGAYAFGIFPMLHVLLDFVLTNDLPTREVAFVDDFTVSRKLAHIKHF